MTSDNGEESLAATRRGHPIDPQLVAVARRSLPTRDDAARLTGVLGLIADPTRSRLLYALDVVPEMCVGDLALALGVNEDAASYALRVLRTAGVVTYRRDGRVLYYRLADGFPESLLQHCLRQLVEVPLGPAEPDEDGERA